ncbi:MAG: hypothetical protein JW850_17050, partial [Thermoflexales bacterium]|nr:hypothetical protein [Thermoflexales bacterium]
YLSGAIVRLGATPAAGWGFAGWSGDADCANGSVTMDANKACTATFTLNTYLLSVSKDGTGSGSVTSTPAGIACGADCSETYAYGRAVTLTATADTGSTFTGWTGAGCSGVGDCTVTIDAARSVTAIFAAAGPGVYHLYLPVVARAFVHAPDLVVSSVTVSGNSVQVVIENHGNMAVPVNSTNEFWVDLYVNPNPLPSGVNQTWNDGRSTQGIAWGVTQDALPALGPGGVLTLTLGDKYYSPDLSNYSSLAPATPIYVQVDSFNTDTAYGAVLESHEITGSAYNNIIGPVLSPSVANGEAVLAPPVIHDQQPAPSGHLPRRP